MSEGDFKIETKEECGIIYKQIVKVMEDIKPIKKDQKNDFHGYYFRGIDDVCNAFKPILVKHGIFIVPEITDTINEILVSGKGKPQVHVILTVRFTVYASDGSYVVASTSGEAMDTGDKACNKAMSFAYKYLFVMLFCLATKDDHDGDENPDIGKDDKKPEGTVNATYNGIMAKVKGAKTLNVLKTVWTDNWNFIRALSEGQQNELRVAKDMRKANIEGGE